MFEELAKVLSKEIEAVSDGKLHCLAASRVLLDFFELRGIAARPLVVRCVIFGQIQDPSLWPQLKPWKLIRSVIDGPKANGGFVIEFVPDGATELTKVTVPFRSLGLPHSGEDGDNTLGNYEGGKWLGHLVVVADNSVIDMTIGQMNDAIHFINFDPPYVLFEDDDLISGRAPFLGSQDGMQVCYIAYPEERTYEISKSWMDPDFRSLSLEIAQRVAEAFEGKPDSALHAVE